MRSSSQSSSVWLPKGTVLLACPIPLNPIPGCAFLPLPLCETVEPHGEAGQPVNLAEK